MSLEMLELYIRPSIRKHTKICVGDHGRSSASSDPNGKRSETVLSDLCEKVLSLEGNICHEALKLFTETKRILSANMANIGSGTREEVERSWFAFVLYSVKMLTVRKGVDGQSVSGDNGFNLCQILRAPNLNIVDFFKELPQFVVKAGPVLCDLYGADWENRLQSTAASSNDVVVFLQEHVRLQLLGCM